MDDQAAQVDEFEGKHDIFHKFPIIFLRITFVTLR